MLKARNLLKECEDRFSDEYDAYPFDGCSGISPTGEPYITYTCQGPKKEGEVISNYGASPMEAVEKWMAKMASLFFFGRLCGHRMYWRVRPEIRGQDGKYYVRSRFLLSSKRCFMPVMKDE